jgi:hypothetical protein
VGDRAADGRAIGTTPNTNVAVPIGPHEVVFRNPDLGERHQTVNVTTKTPSRLTVDLTK